MNLDAYQTRLDEEGSLSLKVKVIPKSQRTEIVGIMSDGSLKVKVAAVPEKGKANAELCTFLARSLHVPQRNVAVIAGETSQHKVVRIFR